MIFRASDIAVALFAALVIMAALTLPSCSMPLRATVEGGVYIFHKPPEKYEEKSPGGVEVKTEGVDPTRARDADKKGGGK